MNLRIISLVVGVCFILTACNDSSESAANSKSVEIDELVSRLSALEEKNAKLETQVEALESSLVDANSQGSLLALQVDELQAEVDEVTSQSTQVNDRLDQVEMLLTCVDFDSSNLNFIVENCNLIVRDGSGSTASSTGLGNLIIGYNRDDLLNKNRTGSHNLVVGDEHQYSSYGGFVAGEENSIEAPYASITGGRENTVGQSYASISGGKGLDLNAENAWAGGDIASIASKVTIDTNEFELKSNGYIGVVSNSSLLLQGGTTVTLDSGSSLNIVGSGNVSLSGSGGVTLSTSASMNIQGSIIQLNGSGMPAARMGDSIVSGGGGGSIITGSATVLIGD